MTNSLSAFYCVNNCRSLFILIVLSTIPIPRNKTVAATPLIGFNQKSLLFVRVIIPVRVTKTAGTKILNRMHDNAWPDGFCKSIYFNIHN